MKKEPLIAILIGIGLGTLLAFIVIKVQNPTLSETDDKTPTPSVNIKIDATPSTDTLLTIISPKNGNISKEYKQKFSGKLKSNAVLLIQSEDYQFIKELPAGDFEEEVELTDGINQISISAINNKESSSVRLNLYVDKNITQ